MINTVNTNTTSNVVVVTAPGPSGPIGPQGPTGSAGTIQTNSGTIVSPFLNVNGSTIITGSLIVSGSNTFINIGPAQFTGSTSILGNLIVNGTSSATLFSGSGANLFDIPASGITGLNLSRVAIGSISASVLTGGNSFIVNNGGTNLFTISNSGAGTLSGGLTVTGVTLLNGTTVLSGTATLNGAAILTSATVSTNRITDSNISASVSSTGKAFSVNNGAAVLANIDQQGAISGSGLNITTGNTFINSPNITLVGTATLNGQPITTAGDLTLNQIKSGAVTASVSTGANSFILENSGITLFRISNTGILSGSGANLFNIPATGITGLNLSQIGSGSFTASISDSKFKVNTDSEITGSLDVTGIISGDGSGLINVPASGVVGLNLSQIATGSVTASVNVGDTNFQITSGSSTLVSLDFTGKLAVSKSINVGVPTSNNWQAGLAGSYFNNFTSNTDVSEMLRFIAGLLSASAPDASPNTRTYGGISENITNTGTITAPAGHIPQDTTTADIIYLTGKGFGAVGSTLFSGKTIYNSTSYGISYSSTAGGITAVSSSADAQLFGLGLLSSGNATPFFTSGTVNWFFSDNNSEAVTATSQSENILSNSSFGTTNGLTVARINTVNPAVIPPAYQDGKFAGVFPSTLFTSNLNIAGRSNTSVSSSGWYHISASIRIATGSSTYSPAQLATERIFWAPISSISIPAQTITFSGVGNNTLTATSRSLSGAPYLLTSTFDFATTVNGAFNPLYTANSTIASITKTDALVTTTGTASVSTTGGTIQTATAVFDSTGITARATNTVPYQTDIIRMTGSATFNAGNAGATNIAQSNLGTTSFVLTHIGKDRAGSNTQGTQTVPYHTAGTFGQPSASGSLAYYGRTSQTYDGGTLTGNSEAFTGEAYRVQLNDNVTTFTGNAWDNSFGLYNLGGQDLQVKPGFLVRPGAAYKYWLNDPDPGQDYKYYIRRFQRTAVLTSFTLNVGKTLIAWDDTSTNNAVAVGIIFESAKGGANNCRIFDPVYAIGSRGVEFTGGTAGTNPFTSTLDYYGAGGAVSGTTYTITVASATSMVLNGTAGSDEIYVIIRYKGDPSPVTSLAVSNT